MALLAQPTCTVSVVPYRRCAVLLVDEPSIGLEPRFIDMVFGILSDLQHKEGKTILMVEQNAARGLDFADIGYVLVSGRVAIAAQGRELLGNPDVGRLVLGGIAAPRTATAS
jgi:branched-chain amino acid transport system ATP-binding protein